ncbi:MAG: hypothetical protein RMJ55_20535, partial [Roseiflexaceae bacterium]|nr:hypothetical protein [Roseiflexaceae bacterium]
NRTRIHMDATDVHGSAEEIIIRGDPLRSVAIRVLLNGTRIHMDATDGRGSAGVGALIRGDP